MEISFKRSLKIHNHVSDHTTNVSILMIYRYIYDVKIAGHRHVFILHAPIKHIILTF